MLAMSKVVVLPPLCSIWSHHNALEVVYAIIVALIKTYPRLCVHDDLYSSFGILPSGGHSLSYVKEN